MNNTGSIIGERLERCGLTGQSKPTAPWSLFTRPLETLALLREQPHWLLAMVLAASYAAAANIYVIGRIGLVRIVTAAVHSSPSVDPEAMLESALAHKNQILAVQAVSTSFGSAITMVVISILLWLLVLVVGGEVDFKRVLAVVTHVTLLTTVLKHSMIAFAATISPHIDSFDIKNPLATNLAFFVRLQSAGGMRILRSLDLLTLASVVLLTIGLGKVSFRMSRLSCALVIVIPWCLYSLAGVWLPMLP